MNPRKVFQFRIYQVCVKREVTSFARDFENRTLYCTHRVGNRWVIFSRVLDLVDIIAHVREGSHTIVTSPSRQVDSRLSLTCVDADKFVLNAFVLS